MNAVEFIAILFIYFCMNSQVITVWSTVSSTLKFDFHILPKRPGVSACRHCVSLIGPCSLSLKYDWLSTSMPDWTWLHQSRARQDDKRAGTKRTKRSRPSVPLRLTHDFCYDKDILNNYFETKILTYFFFISILCVNFTTAFPVKYRIFLGQCPFTLKGTPGKLTVVLYVSVLIPVSKWSRDRHVQTNELRTCHYCSNSAAALSPAGSTSAVSCYSSLSSPGKISYQRSFTNPDVDRTS